MSIHPSLRSSEKDKKQRSVLKRSERLRTMMDKGKWKEGDSVFGLPKIKTLRIRIKKEKAAEKTDAAATEAATPAAGKEAAPAKAASGAKAAPGAKAAEKK